MLPFPSSLLVAGGYAPMSLVLDFAAGQFRAGDRLFHSIDQLPGYAFERMGEQGALDASGSVRWFERDRPAVNDLGLHAYGGTANLLFFSQDLTSPLWSKVGANGAAAPSVGATAGTMPDGSTAGQRLTIGDTSMAANALSVIAANGEAHLGGTGPFTLSIFARGVAGGERIYLGHTADGATFNGAEVTLTQAMERHVVTVSNAHVMLLGHDRRTGQGPMSQEVADLWQVQMIPGHFADGGPLIRTTGTAAGIGASDLRMGLANGTYRATFAFDDGSEQSLEVAVSDEVFRHPVMGALERGIVRKTVVATLP